ncbi:uncharacterized protein N0V89_001053 [Didymosphaeria variabile]|uniref:Uncharacterized protein n=1 Tax=Didymosphaeria variabile TaxID=1932322 RepID=A0A9W8XWD8_9PLEO|nr:uncharacterized protein N0V89_001053 [Didymosphaeria variabile]KAJ4360488.1 hypothetical protein N0V89_001053 [Didymosphaeria variabile]
MTFLGLPRDASPRLKAIQGCQLAIVSLTIVATFLAAVVSQKHKAFTFGLLYPLILISCSTTFFVFREQRRAREGTLTKDKYVKYQLFKLFAAFGLAFVAFVLSIVLGEKKVECDMKLPGEQGLWLGCIKVNTWQALILWMNAFNWIFLWAGVFYSCCMTGNRQGAITLNGEEAHIGLENDTSRDEATARNLQAQDSNWR